ncbi:hypothetical protein FRC08_018699 [Ceratobasidium sp. 394]|nr:hypothetical protein FRC08_018699 [Ceratobasidium sp. 394]
MSGQSGPGGGSSSNSQASLANLFNLTPDQLSALVSTAVQASVLQVVQTLQILRQRVPSEVDSHQAKQLLASATALPKLKDSIYSQWSFAVSDLIRSAGLLGHINGSSQQPDGTDARVLEKRHLEDSAVPSVIMGALDHNMSYRYLEGTSTTQEAWIALEHHYKTSDMASLMGIDRELASL